MTNETRMIPPDLLGDPGWRGALHILGCPLLARKGLMVYVDLKRKSFNYKLMLKRCRVFSSGEYMLLQVAASLFNQDTKINLWNLVNRLDDHNMRLVVEAIEISRFGKLPLRSRVVSAEDDQDSQGYQDEYVSPFPPPEDHEQ